MPDPSDPDATGAHHPAQPTAPAGERFATGAPLAGRYRIIAALVRGGTGEVYRADDLTLGHSVAPKSLLAEPARDPEWLARLRRGADRPADLPGGASELLNTSARFAWAE